MRLIPGKTKVKTELFRGVRIADVIVGVVSVGLVAFLLASSLPGKYVIALFTVLIAAILLVRVDGVPNYQFMLHIMRHFGFTRFYAKDLPKPGPTADSPKGSDTSGENAQDAVPQSESGPESEATAESDTTNEDETVAESQATADSDTADGSETVADSQATAENDTAGESDPTDESKTAAGSEATTENGTAEKTDEEKEAERKAAWAAAALQNDAKIKRADVRSVIAYTGIKDNLIEYDGKYYGAVIEIPPVEFRFFSQFRRNNSIDNGVGRAMRMLPPDYAANLVKIDRPIVFDDYLEVENKKIDELRSSYESGLLREDEFRIRMEIMRDRIDKIKSFGTTDPVIQPFYYIVLFDSDKKQLEISVEHCMSSLQTAELMPKHLNTKEIAVFLKYTNTIDFDEREIDSIEPDKYYEWSLPDYVDIRFRTVDVNRIVTHNYRVVRYPGVVGDAWLAGVMSIPGTKVTVKFRPMDRTSAVRNIDRSLQELRGRFSTTGVDSKRMELQTHIDTLTELLTLLQNDSESLLETNVYVTAYDIVRTRAAGIHVQPGESLRPNIANMTKLIRRLYLDQGLRLNNLEANQMNAFIATQVSAYDPMGKDGRSLPGNTLAAAYPWIYAHTMDKKGVYLGSEDGVPTFIDFFRRDSERVNSNMVIVGKSGSGKSYATKNILAHLAADNSKIFILDPENEYAELAANLHGKFINVGNAQSGRLNPFHIMTTLDADESEGTTSDSSFASHLQFLEEFFKQILPDCEKDALEYLNNLIERMYIRRGISHDTNLSLLRPEDYPTFDDLYDLILEDFQSNQDEYVRTLLRVLMNYVSKFAAGGRNASIWDGPSTVTSDENFTVFNFQSLLANRNNLIANAQMLLVLKYIDNEIIKNRDFNKKYGVNRKIVVVIDEAHVFIDTKYPIALEFMFQLAKRIRKYNGMQIVITQNIKDFVGSEEIARKSTAIINACQYSFIFSLSPNDMDDLCKLYEKAGGINENEQEGIISAARGQTFAVLSPQSRSSFHVDVPANTVSLFKKLGYQGKYYVGESGDVAWEEFIGASRAKHDASRAARTEAETESAACEKPEAAVRLVTLTSPPEITETKTVPETEQAVAEQTRSENKQPDEKPAAPVQKTETVQTVQPISEELITRLTEAVEQLGQVNRESILAEVREMIADMQPARTAEPASDESKPADVNVTNNVGGDNSFMLIDTDADDSEPEEASEKDGDSAPAQATDDKTYSFDFLALLTSEASRLSDISEIDMMASNDKQTLTVSFEELVKYNQLHP